MTSGSETLSSIDEAVQQVRQDLQTLDGEIRAAGDELVRVGQDEAQRFRKLAEMRLGHLGSGELLSEMDDADRRVTELLRQRGAALGTLQKKIEESDRVQSEFESKRRGLLERINAASEAVDRAEAVTQKRLSGQPEYQDQLNRARSSDSVAKHADDKAAQAEKDRAEKGTQFEADSLFVYLWKRGYGTSAYSANPLIRLLDGWVARLCRYHDARPNYSMLLEIPRRLREHAQRARAEADAEFAALKSIEEKAQAVDGVPGLREKLAEERKRMLEIDEALKQEETSNAGLLKERSEFAGGADPYSRECLLVLIDQMRREPLPQLRREAEQTNSSEDNIVVQELADLQAVKARLDSQLAQQKQIHERHVNRLDELEKVRWDFKRNRYDGVHSTFPNGEVIGAILGQFLRGMASSGQLWNTIERQHQHRRIDADPDFGSGGFGPAAGGGWSFPIPNIGSGGFGFPSGGGGGGGGGGSVGIPTSGHIPSGGGFRTGGGF